MAEKDTQRLRGKVALVTGVASDKGIGRAIALGYARHGASVACVDVDEAGCQATVAMIEAAGQNALALTCEVSDQEQVHRAIAQTVERFGRLDILVNNAGLARFGPLLDVAEDEWDRVMAVNLKGYFLFSQAAARVMIAQRGEAHAGGRGAESPAGKVGGCIINISSMSAESADEMKVAYCVSKAGVKMLTQGAAIEWATHRIRVNAIAPGYIDTNIVQDARVRRAVENTDLGAMVPLGRCGDAEDVVGAAVFLASSEANYITGVHLLVDGGLSAGNAFPLEI